VNYVQAVAHARAGGNVMRQGWCFLWMYADTKGILRTRSESGDLNVFQPTTEERLATDWMVKPD